MNIIYSHFTNLETWDTYRCAEMLDLWHELPIPVMNDWTLSLSERLGKYLVKKEAIENTAP